MKEKLKLVNMRTITKLSKFLAKRHALMANINVDDHWKLYAPDYLADIGAMLGEVNDASN